MPGAERSRQTIGSNRTWILGRILGGVFFLLIILPILLPVGLIIALVYAVVDGIYTLILNRPLNIKRAWAYALFMYSVKWAKYVLGGASYPGLLPRASHGSR